MGSKILWAIVGGFLSGVFARSFLPLGIAYECFLILLACTIPVVGFLDRVKFRASIVIAVALVATSIGIMRMDSATLVGDTNLTALLGKQVTLIGTVVREPDVRDTGVRIAINVSGLVIASSTTAIHAGVLIKAPLHTIVHYGDEVHASGTLDLPQAFSTTPANDINGAHAERQFDYPDYLGASGIAYTLSFARIKSDNKNSGNILQTLAIDIKEKYLRGTDAVLPEPEAGLAGGITVGDKRSIGPDLSTDFQRVGLLQIVVLSGYNITVVANFASALLSWSSRYFQFGAGIFVIIFFMLISGGASSAARAGLMAVLGMYARISGRTYESLRALGVTALIMVAWNPFTLAFDPGFQLSALAMLGLTLFTPTIELYLQWITKQFGFREIISTTLATQIAVLPLILYQDGMLSLLSLPANVLAMIPVPFAMLASLVAALFGIIFGTYAAPLSYPAYILLAYIIKIAHVLASLPFAAVSIGVFSVWWMFGTYAILFGGLYWYSIFWKKRSGEVNSSAAPIVSIT
jgi:competence protein ComEC